MSSSNTIPDPSGKSRKSGGINEHGDGSGELVVGKIASPFGVRGWTKILSYTDPKEGLLDHAAWSVKHRGSQKVYTVIEGKAHGKFLIAKFEGIDDRDEVAKLTNALIVLDRGLLPEAGDDTYYWADLIGLRVVTVEGIEFGEVDRMMETGANDVVVVSGERERLIPWVIGTVVKSVDLTNKTITVDWDSEF